jgi:hypothetical protein
MCNVQACMVTDDHVVAVDSEYVLGEALSLCLVFAISFDVCFVVGFRAEICGHDVVSREEISR